MDIVKFLFQYIPPHIVYKGKEYQFVIFINHAHYDLRFCYQTLDGEEFLFLVENIDNQKELIEDLKMLREQLRKKRLLKGDYAKEDGYTKSIYNAWLKSLDKK